MENICNADSVLYNLPCKYFLSDDGNKCRYGRECHYLHYTHLHREPVETRDLHLEVRRLQTEVAKQGKIVDLLTSKLQVHFSPQALHTTEEAGDYKLDHASPPLISPPLTSSPLSCALLTANKTCSQNSRIEIKPKTHDRSATTPGRPAHDAHDHQVDNNSARVEPKSTLNPLAETYPNNEPAPAPTTKIPNSHILEFPDKILNANVNIDAEDQEFMKFIWANSSLHLSALLPAEALPDEYRADGVVLIGTSTDGVVFEDAQLYNLNTAQHNGKLIRIREFVKSRSRYKVEIIEDPDADPQHMLVRRQNIQVLQMRDISKAFQDFVDHLDNKPDLLELLRKDRAGNRIIGEFLNFQIPPIEKPELISQGHAWNDIEYYMTSACKRSNLTISKRDCPQIISLLYALCFEKVSTYYIWKRYLIPSTWSIKKWSTCYGVSALTRPDLTS